MGKRQQIAIGMAFGVLWGVVVIWIASTQVQIPVFSRVLVEPFYTLAPGLVILAMIARIAARRFLDASLIDGQVPPPGSSAEIDNRVLRDTIEQAVLGICLWIPISFILAEDGIAVALCLSISFAFARLAFWIGAHLSAPLRAFGFAATFLPTVMALIWSVLWWFVR